MSEQDIERQPDSDVEGHVWMADGPPDTDDDAEGHVWMADGPDTDEDEDTEGHLYSVQPPRDASTEGSPF